MAGNDEAVDGGRSHRRRVDVIESAGAKTDRTCPSDRDPAVTADVSVAVDDRALELRIAILATAIPTSLHLSFRQEVNEIFGGEELNLPLPVDLNPLDQIESLADAQEQIGALGRGEAIRRAPADDPVCQLLRRVG